MLGYTQRVKDSILPWSIADTLPDAFAEWAFTENTVDHEAPIKTCELCGQHPARPHALRSVTVPGRVGGAHGGSRDRLTVATFREAPTIKASADNLGSG